MTDKEQTRDWSEPLDWRIDMLRPLVHADIITFDEMFDMIDNTTVDTPPETFYGIVSGEFDVPSRDISRALEGTRWEIAVEDIEVQKKSYKEWFQNLGSNIVRVGEAVADTNQMVNLPQEFAVMGGAAIGSYLSKNFSSRVIDDETKRRLESDQEKMLTIVEEARSKRYIGDDTASEYRVTIKGWLGSDVLAGMNYEPSLTKTQDVFKIIDEINASGLTTNRIEELETPPPMTVKQTEAAREAARLAGFERDTPLEVAPEDRAGYFAMYGVYREGRLLADETAAERGDLSNLSFADLLGALGMEENRLSGKSREELDFLGYDLSSEGEVIDRVSGVALTLNQVEILQKDERWRDAYRELRRPSPIVQEMLDSNKFATGRTGRLDLFKGGLPVEDLALPTLFPSEDYEIDMYKYSGSMESRAEWMSMSTRKKNNLINIMEASGVMENAPFNPLDPSGNDYGLRVWDAVKYASSVQQEDPYSILTQLGKDNRDYQARLDSAGDSGRGRSAPTYSVPASLREIPDYKTLAEQTKNVFSQQLGRDMEDWELALLADELKDKYVQQGEQRRDIHKSAWNDAVAGGSVNVDFTAVEDPMSALQFDIKEKYAAELDRYERVDDRANNRKLLLNSIAVGERMT